MKKQKKMMIRLALKTMTIALVLSLNSPTILSAFDDVDAGYYMWRLINEARVRPVDVMLKYGITEEQARGALGENDWILDLENGLPPLAWNNQLADSSSGHTSDMISGMYYAYDSKDGTRFDQRIEKAGYNAKSTGESLGLLAFNVYLEPLDAVEKLFENMLKDELNPLIPGQKNIFSIDHTEIGIGFTSSVFTLEDAPPFNAYVVTADFAAPVEPRYYIMGHFYNEETSSSAGFCNDGEVCVGGSPRQPAVAVHDWLYENPVATDTMLLQMNYLSGDASFDVPVDTFSGYQVLVPHWGFFLIQVYDHIDDLVIQRAGIGMNVNQLMDFGIATD